MLCSILNSMGSLCGCFEELYFLPVLFYIVGFLSVRVALEPGHAEGWINVGERLCHSSLSM